MANKVKLPSSSSGLIQYYDDYKSKLEISPTQVIIITVAVMVAVLIMHLLGSRIFGF